MKTLFLNKLKNIIEIKTYFLFFLFFIFLLPFKSRFEFFTEYSFFNGRFFDYLTVSFYIFEFFLLSSLFIWFIFILKNRKKINLNFGNSKITLFLFLVFISSLISVMFSQSFFISIYYILVLILLLFSYFFVLNNLSFKKNLIIFYNVFVFSFFIQSIIVVFQFFQNESLGLGLLGESYLSPNINGVAKIIFEGEKHIRPYGTFSHPNILAIFLSITGVFNIYLYSVAKEKIQRFFLVISFLFISVSLFLSFSRVAWLVAFPFWFFYIYKTFYFKKIFSKKTKNIFIFITLLIALSFLIYFLPSIWWRINPFLGSTWESLGDRLIVFEKSFELLKQKPMGVGIGNFIISIADSLKSHPSWMVEPVHNTFFLVLVELGILGFSFFMVLFFYLFKFFKKLNLEMKIVFLMLFIFMFFDHGFWDIRQAQYLFFICLGLLSINIEKKDL